MAYSREASKRNEVKTLLAVDSAFDDQDVARSSVPLSELGRRGGIPKETAIAAMWRLRRRRLVVYDRETEQVSLSEEGARAADVVQREAVLSRMYFPFSSVPAKIAANVRARRPLDEQMVLDAIAHVESLQEYAGPQGTADAVISVLKPTHVRSEDGSSYEEAVATILIRLRRARRVRFSPISDGHMVVFVRPDDNSEIASEDDDRPTTTSAAEAPSTVAQLTPHPGRPLSEKEHASTRSIWETTGSTDSFAAATGLSKTAARNRLLAAGIELAEPNDMKEPSRELQKRCAAAVYAESRSLRAVGAALDVSIGTARKLLKDAGVELEPPTPKVKDEEIAESVAAYAELKSMRAAGRKLGRSPSTISHHLRLHRERQVARIP